MTKLALVSDQLSFDYAQVDDATAVEAREAAQRIKLRLRRSAEDIIEIGKDLISVKDRLPHGSFLPWIDAEFGMRHSTASSFMQVAKVYGDKLPTIGNLTATALYELAAPKTPIEVREEVERMIEAGEVVTKATVAELRDRLSGLEKAKVRAEEEVSETATKLEELTLSADERIASEVDKAAKRIANEYADEIARLTAQVQELSRKKIVEGGQAGQVVPFHRELTDTERAAVDAVEDDFTDIVDTASPDRDRAAVVVGSLRSIARMNAAPEAVLALLVDGYSKRLANEHIAMLDAVISLLKTVKDHHNG